jgi:hypothetical protein
VLGFSAYQEALDAYWPEYGPDGLPLTPMPEDPVARDRLLNIKIAEMYLIGAGLTDFVLTLKGQSIGRVRSSDAGSEAEFELRADDASFYLEVRRRYLTRAFAALRRAGYAGASAALVSRVSAWEPRMDVLYTVTRAS